MILPIPTWGKEDLWSSLDAKLIESVIQGLTCLLREGLKGIEIKENTSKKALIIHTVYAIADKLARRDPKNNLQGYASPYLPLLLDRMYPREVTSIPMGKEHVRYARIVAYFEQSWHASQKKVIFPIAPVLSVEKFVYDSTHGGSRDSQGDCHIQFLQNFLTAAFIQHNNRMLLPLYMKIWSDPQKKYLPLAIHSLYYFAFLSHLLYSSGYSNQTFPQTLTFQSGIDYQGRTALTIDDQKGGFFSSFLS
jgi:hypothetical protein